MSTPEYLAARDLNGRAEKLEHRPIPAGTGDADLDERLSALAGRASSPEHREIILQMLTTVMHAASSSLKEHDLRQMSCAIKEMLQSEQLFAPYEQVRKITCFGSARIQKGTDSYQIAYDFARHATDAGYMIITGGGPGIMQACNEGAGRDMSFGLNITLPFEQHPNEAIAGSDKMMDFYYFFTRKLHLVKQADALVAFPGGFGTMDEIYETITLMQTGKATIFPVVLVDPAGEYFWSRWQNFVKKELLHAGLISPEDVDLLYITKSAEDALEHIQHFYRRFHSYYFDAEVLTIRLREPVTEETLERMRVEYADIMPKGDLTQLEACVHDHEQILSTLPRLRFSFNLGDYARLRQLIDDINE